MTPIKLNYMMMLDSKECRVTKAGGDGEKDTSVQIINVPRALLRLTSPKDECRTVLPITQTKLRYRVTLESKIMTRNGSRLVAEERTQLSILSLQLNSR